MPQQTVRVNIVHGYGASPTSHWFPWLIRQVEAAGGQAKALTLPTPDTPDPQQWDAALTAQIVAPDEHTWIVGHSLGCITAVRWLIAHQVQVSGIILVSGFFEPLPDYPELDPFVADGVDVSEAVGLAPRRLVIAAEDDPVVPYARSRHLAERIDARFESHQRGGHFMGSDGFFEFPPVWQELSQHFR